MSIGKFQNKYRIPSTRAVWHDYNGGAYFITICTKTREHYFGEIENGIMRLSEIGKYAHENLQNINTHYPYAEIPLFVIMPNHIHAIVFIDENKSTRKVSNKPQCLCRDVARYVSRSQSFKQSAETFNTKSFDALHETTRDVARDVTRYVSTNEKMKNIAQHQSLLGFAMRGFKSAVTTFAKQHDFEFAWQSRFHDSIIRNQEMMNMVANYIENNVARWQQDCFHKNNENKGSADFPG